MILLPQRPTYYDHEDPEKRLDAIGTYLNDLKNELERVLSEIPYDSLDSGVHTRFENINKTFSRLEYDLNQLRTDLNVNFTRTKDVKENGITVGSHTYTEKTATIDGTTIHYLGYEETP